VDAAELDIFYHNHRISQQKTVIRGLAVNTTCWEYSTNTVSPDWCSAKQFNHTKVYKNTMAAEIND